MLCRGLVQKCRANNSMSRQYPKHVKGKVRNDSFYHQCHVIIFAQLAFENIRNVRRGKWRWHW